MLLEVRDVSAGYRHGVQILHDLSIRVDRGEIVCLVGPNGAGKSTLLRVIVRLLKPSRGQVLFGEEDVTGLRPDQILRKGICMVPQERSSFRGMSVHENLLMGAYTLKSESEIRARLARIYESFPIIREKREQKAGNLSGGEQRILEIARALMLDPILLLLDEPSIGLEPRLRKLIFQTVQDLNRQGITVLMAEQNARSGLAISHRGYVLDLGRQKFEGKAIELLANPEMQKLYLGGSKLTGSSSSS